MLIKRQYGQYQRQCFVIYVYETCIHSSNHKTSPFLYYSTGTGTHAAVS
jgi:hypothetical protein